MYIYQPIEFNGTSLLTSNFLAVDFDSQNGPVATRVFDPVEAAVTELGDRDVRAQPKGAFWQLNVVLRNINQSDHETMLDVFDEEAGLVVLKARDNAEPAAVVWRVNVRVVRIERLGRAWGHFRVTLRVPDPTWQEDVQTSQNTANMSGATQAFSLVNNGNRSTRPAFTVSADAVKGDYIDDYAEALRGVIWNGAEVGITDYPVEIVNDTGAIDHAAIVTDTERADIDDIGDIDATQTTIVYDTGRNGNLPTRGMAMIESEQISYTGGGGGASGTLTGVTRGVGGTTGAIHLDGVAISASFGLLNGDDIRVWDNDVEVARWIDGANTTTLKVWINVSMPARIRLTLRAAITAGVPADGGQLEFNESIARLPERGFIFFDISNELISYRGKSGKFIQNIERGAWGSTAAINAINATGHFAAHVFVVGSGKALADGSAPDAVTRRPAIQLAGSDNDTWMWGDTVDDGDTVFYDPDEPRRTAMWRPDDTFAADNLAQGLRAEVTTNRLVWEDSAVDGKKPLTPRYAIELPQGAVQPTTLTFDVQQRADHMINVYFKDTDGRLFLGQSYHDVDDTGLTNTTLSVSPNTIDLKGLVVEGIRASVCGNGEADDDVDVTGVISVRQQVILDQETEIKELHLLLRKVGAGDSFTFAVRIRDNTGSDPSQGRIMVTFDTGPTSAGDLTIGRIRYGFQSNGGDFTLPAGTYWIEIDTTVYGSGTFQIARGKPSTKHLLTHSGLGFGTDPMWFRIIHTERRPGPIQPESDVLNNALISDFDELEFKCGVSRPDVHRFSGFASTVMYHCVGTINNATTGQNIAINKWIELSPAQLVIDCDARTVIYTEGNTVYPIPAAIAPDDLAQWLRLARGSNSMNYNEDNMANTDLISVYRGKKV